VLLRASEARSSKRCVANAVVILDDGVGTKIVMLGAEVKIVGIADALAAVL
jgi:hypothetical protein